jgi:hypothetical protein
MVGFSKKLTDIGFQFWFFGIGFILFLDGLFLGYQLVLVFLGIGQLN